MNSTSCTRCGLDHSTPEAFDALAKASQTESEENREIDAMLFAKFLNVGEDDGRRSSIAASLRFDQAVYCAVTTLRQAPQTSLENTWHRSFWVIALAALALVCLLLNYLWRL